MRYQGRTFVAVCNYRCIANRCSETGGGEKCRETMVSCGDSMPCHVLGHQRGCHSGTKSRIDRTIPRLLGNSTHRGGRGGNTPSLPDSWGSFRMLRITMPTCRPIDIMKSIQWHIVPGICLYASGQVKASNPKYNQEPVLTPGDAAPSRRRLSSSARIARAISSAWAESSELGT